LGRKNYKRFSSAVLLWPLRSAKREFGWRARKSGGGMSPLGYEMRMTLFGRALLLVAGCILLSSCGTGPGLRVKDTTRTFTTVVVDAGHGGKDNGAFRRYGGAEKNATLDVATRLAAKLRESQFRVVMTRSGDVFIPLDERAAISNRQSNAIFVSVHFNDSGRRGIRGFETYYHSPVARNLAYRIQQRLMTLPGAVNRGVKTANFRVLRKAEYPAVLVECGFLSNRKEGAAARSASRRDDLADKIAEAIVDERYGKGTYKGPSTASDAAATSSAHD
jgi:N-acetylmuramoyl-L-alanine amidase